MGSNYWSSFFRKRGPKCARKNVAMRQSKSVVCLDTNVIFESVKEAASWAGVKDSTLVGCLKGNRETAGGFHWKYSDSDRKE